MEDSRKKASAILEQMSRTIELTEQCSTFVETRTVDLTFSSAQLIGAVCNYLMCLRDDRNGDLYYIDEYESFNSIENIYNLRYRGKDWRFLCSPLSRIRLKPDAVIYELE